MGVGCLSDQSLLRLARKAPEKEKGKESAQLIEHLHKCAKCREALRDLQRTLDELEQEIRYGGFFSS